MMQRQWGSIRGAITAVLIRPGVVGLITIISSGKNWIFRAIIFITIIIRIQKPIYNGKLPDASYLYNENAYTDNLNNTHRVNLNMLYQLDSTNTIRITPSFSYQKSKNKSLRDYSTYLTGMTLANDGNSNSINANEGYNFTNNIIWRKKFARKGQTFSLSLQTNLNEQQW